jgi:hypothetical protein
MRIKTVAIVADFNASNQSHLATNQAIQHSSDALGTAFEVCWIDTEKVAGTDASVVLRDFSGLWIGPASPNRSAEGALAAIRVARESRIPLLGTCGGFHTASIPSRWSISCCSSSDSTPSVGNALLRPTRITITEPEGHVTLHANEEVRKTHGVISKLDSFIAQVGHDWIDEQPRFVDVKVNDSLEHADLRSCDGSTPAVFRTKPHQGIVEIISYRYRGRQFLSSNRFAPLI